MSEYAMIVKHESVQVASSLEEKLTGSKKINYIAKRCPGRQNKFIIISEFWNESDAQFALDALNEKHNFEYVTNKDS